MELELHQVEQRYSALRRRDGRRERALAASLMEAGQQAPIIVVEGESGRYILVDGYKRVRALEKLHRDTVEAVVWAVSEPEALLLERLMRSAEGDSALEQGWLLKELHERFGLSAGELARRFDKTTSWVSRRLGLVRELPETVQELVRRGELAAHAAMKHLVPLARANAEECAQLAPVLAGHGLSSRQVATLCAAWATATPESRSLILQEPLMVLRAEQESRRPKELSPGQRLLSDVAAIAAIARRARRLVGDGAGQVVPAAELTGALGAARADTAALFAVIDKEVTRA